jgi:predicted alpha/beta hydrolase
VDDTPATPTAAVQAPADPQPQVITPVASDGVGVPLQRFAAAQPRAALLLLPALGVRARLYRHYAAGLAAQGVSCWVMEQRGHGDSPLRASGRQRWRFADILDRDIPLAIDSLREHEGNLPLILGGHSLGGHFATITAGRCPEALQGLLHIACGFPYHGDYPGRQGRMVRWLCRLIPMFNFYPGYYPGRLVGFGERESLGLMHNWSEWARSGSFDFDGRRGVAAAVAQFRGPALSITLDADPLVTPAALERARSPLVNAQLTLRTLGEAEQGQYRDHASWTMAPAGVIAATVDWIDACCA